MQIPEPDSLYPAAPLRRPRQGRRRSFLAALCLPLFIALASAGCKQDVATEASDSDANGYLCLKCGVKLYTDRSVFIGPRCPKCNEDTLMDLVGYRCAKDQHMTMRPRRGDRGGAVVCEQCSAPVGNAMYLPRAKDLKSWGATYTKP